MTNPDGFQQRMDDFKPRTTGRVDVPDIGWPPETASRTGTHPISRAWDAAAHPRAPAGATGGGQFAPASQGSGQAKDKQPKKDTRATPSNAHPVGMGEKGKRVSDLQARLKALGYDLGPAGVDGIFGPKTLAAVRAFQKAHGLKVDGLVGPKTTAALRTKPAAKPAVKHPAKAPAKPPAKPAAKVVAAKEALAKTAAKAATRAMAHEKVGHTGQGLWHDKNRQLPAFIQHIANDLIQQRGMPESEAIATAVAQCKKWAAGGGDVKPDTQAKAQAAIAEWERLKARASASRSTPAVSGGHDADGLDGSWDDLSGLPDLTGLGVADFEAADTGPAEGMSRATRLGTGARFAALKAALASKGAHDPGALAAYIGRKRYGKAKFTALAASARKGKGGSMRRSYDEWIRPMIPLEDIHIMSRAEGDGSGTTVEAYATVFDQPTPIEDHQGKYTEIIDRSAFDTVLAQIRRNRGGLAGSVKVLFNHGRTIGGQEAPEFQLPIGIPLDIRPESRGLLTRTQFDAGDPFTERILSKIRSGAINTYSFVGGIIRSDPQLRGPGDKYRESNGVRPTVRRMVLGLREYGPVIWAAYPGAEVLGVRMGSPEMYGSYEDVIVTDDELSEVEESAPGMDGDDTGGTPEEVHPTRDHAHRLYALRTEQMLREAGITSLKGGW